MKLCHQNTFLNFELKDTDMMNILMLLTYQQKVAEVRGEGVGPWKLAGDQVEGPAQM